METKELIDYFKEAAQIREVWRASIWEPQFRNNDAEHCFTMIVMADKLINHYKLNLDFRKVVRYIYLHDWGEIGMKNDICAPQKQGSEREAIKKAEHENARKSLMKFNLVDDIKDYDDFNNLANDEARFVMAIDKLDCGLFFLSKGMDKMLESQIDDKGNFIHSVFKTPQDMIDFETSYPNKATAFFPPIKDFVDEIIKAMKKQLSKYDS